MPIHIFETQSFLPNLLDSSSTTHQTAEETCSWRRCVYQALLYKQPLTTQTFSPELLPNSLAHIPAHPSDSPAHKQLSPKDATRNVQLSQPTSR